MGVTYKLKPEIIARIVQKKKDSPSISCRALAEIIGQEFGQDISKSSISSILKQAQLSNPVGRRSGSVRVKDNGLPKKFQLPEKKKKEIFSGLSQYDVGPGNTLHVQDSSLLDGIGSIFLKAAEWEVARQPVFETMLMDSCAGVQPDTIKAVAAALGYLKAFHIESLEGLSHYEGQGLWAINGLKAPISETEVLDVIENVKDQKQLFLQFSLKAPQLFSRALGFRFILKDGSNFFIDGQMASIWKNVQKRFSVSLAKATDLLAEILNNVQCSIFCSISPKESGKSQESKQIIDFIQAFQNVQSKKIQRIELLGEDGQILGNFDEIPQIKRCFIAGVWPWEKMFHRFLDLKRPEIQGKIRLGPDEREISFQEVSLKWADGKAMILRGILLYEAFMTLPFVVLMTNMDSAQLSAQAVVEQYYSRWPNMDQGGSFSVFSDPSIWSADFPDEEGVFWDILLGEIPYGRSAVWAAANQFSDLLDRFAKKQFFPEEYAAMDFFTMQNRFYKLPGQIDQSSNGLTVNIRAPKDFPYLRDVIFAAQRVNESGVRTFSGNAISIKII